MAGPNAKSGHDTPINGATFRALKPLADYNREALHIEVHFAMPAPRIIRALDQIADWRGGGETESHTLK